MSIDESMFRLGRSVIGVSFALLLANPANAFETVYGAPAAAENGARGVAPVRFCPNGGFIAAGTRTLGNAADVYVVRTRVDGSVLWERFYDIGGAGAVDRGNSIVERRGGGGFVVVGSSTVSGNQDALFLSLDCNGNVGLALTYGSTLTDVAADVLEAQTGNGVTTSPGDLVIAGQTVNPAGNNTDAFLLRVRAGGAVISGNVCSARSSRVASQELSSRAGRLRRTLRTAARRRYSRRAFAREMVFAAPGARPWSKSGTLVGVDPPSRSRSPAT